jgi:cobalt-zinc-cadmium efflux system protein
VDPHQKSHHHSPRNHNFLFFLGISLNLGFVFLEVVYGILGHSLALVADAGHNLSDVFGLGLAWGAFWLGKRRPTSKYTYGLRKSSILSSLMNSILLLMAVGVLIWESLHRMGNPVPVNTLTVIALAGLGIIVNTSTALLFLKDRHHDLNIRSLFLHMATDALISLGVLFSAILIRFTSWYWIDPVIGLTISVVIFWTTWDLLRNAFELSMDAVPSGIDPLGVKNFFQGLEGVIESHDLHIWAISTIETALSVHLVLREPDRENRLLKKITCGLKKEFNIHHPTIQFEIENIDFNCDQMPEESV